MKRLRDSSSLMGAVFLILLVLAPVSALAVCDVCSSGCSFSSIQAAIESAGPGDTIEVCPGTYSENIDFMGKTVTLISRDGAETTIIDGDRSGSVVTFDSGESAGSVLEGFTLQNGTGTWAGLSYGGGIYCGDAAPTIRNSVITDNMAAYGAGLYLSGCDAALSGCVISRNGTTAYDGAGLYAADSSPVISECTFENNSVQRHGGGIYAESSVLTITDSTLNENWATRFPSGKGGGIYLEESELVLSGSSLVENRADDYGGGLYGDSDSRVAITATTLAENEVDNSGAGAYLSGGTPEIVSSVFRANVSGLDGGGLYLLQTGGSISDSLFIRNRTGANGTGGGIVFNRANTSIDNANITENTAGVAGGGIWIYNESDPAVSGSTIAANTAGSDGGGVIVTRFSSPSFVNTVFHNNFLTGVLPGFGTGGGVAVYQSSPVNIINCTLRFNLATEQGGGLYSEFSDVTVTNSIVWGNTPDQIGYRGSSDVPVVTWSDVQGGYSGTGNINETPQFVNLLNAHLKGASLAIDAGTSTGAPAEDIDGDARPADAGVDMGADEYVGDVRPVPSITANDMGGAVTIDRSETPELVFTFSLDNRGRTDLADWWIIFSSRAGTYFLTTGGLTEEFAPFLQLPLFDATAGYDYPPIPLEGMPLGAFTVFFAVDTDQDGLLSWTNLYYDWVRVNLTE